jgi:hypothetical protein
MSRYYHCTTDAYQDGDDLLCFDLLLARGDNPAWKWGDEQAEDEQCMDTDVVCMTAGLEEARKFTTEGWASRILAIDVPPDQRILRVTEGYPAIARKIPAQWISAIT